MHWSVERAIEFLTDIGEYVNTISDKKYSVLAERIVKTAEEIKNDLEVYNA